MATPSTQKADQRPISFVLSDERTGQLEQLGLIIRPEDLSRPEPALQNAVQTFGGAWIDDFGPGLSTIQISGHTGWRGGASMDGAAAWLAFRDTLWTSYHAKRADAASQGQDPNQIKLIFVDTLDRIVAVVYPSSLTLKRNRARPLLFMYAVTLTILTDNVGPDTLDDLGLSDQGLPNSSSIPNGIASLAGSLNTLQSMAAGIRSEVDSVIGQPMHDLMTMSSQVLGMVNSVVDPVNGVVTAEAAQLTGIASDLSQVGRNAFQAYAAVASLPDTVMHDIATVASEFENAVCILRNVFRTQIQYPDYTGLYGSSSCSSTLGGSPISAYVGQNPFETIVDTSTPAIQVTSGSKAAMGRIKAVDPVLAPPSTTQLASDLAQVTAGVTLL